MQKSYYVENGLYFDVTTNRIYQPNHFCELCGGHSHLTVHHFLFQHKCLKDLATKKTITPSTWTAEYINQHQKLFTLCRQCHSDVHSMSNERFYEKYGKQRSYYVFIKNNVYTNM